MRIIVTNYADTATLTASPAMLTDLPVGNLQDQSREKVARTSSLAAQTIDVTLDAARPLAACVLYRGNFSATATWRVRVYDTPAMGTLLYDSGAGGVYLAGPKTLGDLEWGIDPLGATLFDGWGYTFSSLWFSVVVGQFVRITLTDADNPDGYMQASRLFLGTYIEPIGMPVPGMSLHWQETTTHSRTDGGTLRSEPGAGYRALTVHGERLVEKTRVDLSSLNRDAGMRHDVYVSVFPELGTALERDHQMQAKLIALDPSVIPIYGTVNQTLRFEEI